MSFLEIVPGFRVPVNAGSRRPERVGARRGRSFRGRAQEGGRGNRSVFPFKTAIASYDESKTFQNIISGLGEVFYFRDGLQGSKGLMPKEVGTVSFNRTVGTPFSGFQGNGVETDSPDGYLVYDPQLGVDYSLNSDWSVMWLEFSHTDSAWHRSAMRSDGTFVFDGTIDNDSWVNGRGSPAEWSVAVKDGQLRLEGQGGDGGVMHHLVVLPYIISDTLISAFMTAEKPWGPLPDLYVEGDLIKSDHEYFKGRMKSSGFRRSTINGSGIVNNNLELDFELHAIADSYRLDASVPSQGSVTPADEPDEIGAFAVVGRLKSNFTVSSKASAGAVKTIIGSATNDWKALVIRTDVDGEVVLHACAQGAINNGGSGLTIGGGCAVIGDDTYACGWSRDANIQVLNHDGSIGAVLARPLSTRPPLGLDYSWVAKWGADGVVAWAKTNGWAASADAQFSSVRYRSMSAVNGKLYLAGYTRIPVTSPNPTFGGGIEYTVPGSVHRVSGAFRLELDTNTGDATSIFIVDRIQTGGIWDTYAHGDTVHLVPTKNKLGHLLAAAHSGGDPGVSTSVVVGRGHASAFSSRNIALGTSAARLGAYMAKVALDGTPQRVVSARYGTGTTSVSSRRLPGVPASLSDGVAWCFTGSTSEAVLTHNVNRDPSPYASGDVVSGTDKNLRIQVLGADLQEPTVNKDLVKGIASGGEQAFTASLAASGDEAAIFCQVNNGEILSTGGGANRVVDFLESGATETFNTGDAVFIRMSKASGAREWISRFQQAAVASLVRYAGAKEYVSGPSKGRLEAVLSCYNGTAHGGPLNASDGSLGYDVYDQWGGGATAPLARGLHVVAISPAVGDIDAANSWQVASFNSALGIGQAVFF